MQTKQRQSSKSVPATRTPHVEYLVIHEQKVLFQSPVRSASARYIQASGMGEMVASIAVDTSDVNPSHRLAAAAKRSNDAVRANQAKVYLVTCGGKFVMASGKRAEVAAYAETYNKYRLPTEPAATITTTLINLPTWPAE